MYMFLLDMWASWYIGTAIGNFLGKITVPFLVAAVLWFFSPLVLAYVVYTSVRDYVKTRKARRNAYIYG